jgi:ribonuclease HII
MDQTFDRLFYTKCSSLAGVDEVGVTAIAGPVVAACVVLPRLTSEDDLRLFLIDDSKKLSEKKRMQNAKIIQQSAIAYGLGIVHPHEFDAIHSFSSCNLAMKRAINDCFNRFGPYGLDFCIIDGDRQIDLDVPYELIVKGDMKSLSIASASILAKVHHDSIMKKFHSIRPEYGFDSNKGYRSEKHYDGLDKRGIWVGVHRASLFPICREPHEPYVWTKRRKLWIKKTEATLLECQ